MKRTLTAAFTAALLAVGGIGFAAPAAAEQPDFICEAYDSDKIDTEGDPATVEVTAPDGMLIDGYCVKAADIKVFIPVDPPLKTVIIDHPDVDSVSHYALSYVEDENPGEQPDPQTRQIVVEGVPDCETLTVSITTTNFATPYVLVEGEWVLGTEAQVGEPLVTTRPATAEECPPPPPTFDPTCVSVTGSAVIEGTGVIEVPGDWASESIDVPFTGTLADIGTVLNIEATPLQYVGLHIDTAEGTIVFEEEPSYNGNLWSTSAWAGVEAGLGYAAFGSIEQFIELNGDVVVDGIRLLYTHPEASSTTVTSFVIGCTVYTFEPPVDVPEQPAPEQRVEDREVVDCEAGFAVTLRTTFETPYVLVENEWVLGEEVQVGVETQYGEPREVTLEECPPVEEPPVEEPPVVTPPVNKPPVVVTTVTPPTTLATTGAAEMQPLGLLAAMLIALGALFAGVSVVRARQK